MSRDGHRVHANIVGRGGVDGLGRLWLIQSGIWRELNPGYLALNIIGSLLLGIVAVAERQAGFILLEFAWIGLGLIGVVRAWKARRLSRAAA
jgi:fluoride ion exporter CrcB/FEX